MKVKKLALAIGITFTTLAASPSYALLVTTSVQSSASAVVNGATTSATHGPAGDVASDVSDTGYQGDYYLQAYGNASGNDSGISSAGGYSNVYNAGSSENRTTHSISTNASVLHTAVITNDTGADQNIDFSFLIWGGNLFNSASGTDQANSGYLADIRVNGNSLWQSGVNLLTQGGSIGTLSLTGTILDSSYTGNQFNTNGSFSYDNSIYNWDNYNGALDLGVLSAGASLTLEYELSAYTNVYMEHSGYATAGIGDPFNFNTTPVFSPDNFTVTPADPGNPTDVPEPAGTLLLGAGLAALAFRRRKERKTTL